MLFIQAFINVEVVGNCWQLWCLFTRQIVVVWRGVPEYCYSSAKNSLWPRMTGIQKSHDGWMQYEFIFLFACTIPAIPDCMSLLDTQLINIRSSVIFVIVETICLGNYYVLECLIAYLHIICGFWVFDSSFQRFCDLTNSPCLLLVSFKRSLKCNTFWSAASPSRTRRGVHQQHTV